MWGSLAQSRAGFSEVVAPRVHVWVIHGPFRRQYLHGEGSSFPPLPLQPRVAATSWSYLWHKREGGWLFFSLASDSIL